MEVEPYSYVIVGGGTAGSVLAGRLTEDPHATVVILEAGAADDVDENILVPSMFRALFKGALDWDHTTEEQSHLNGRKLYWPRGKVLGGCSSTNAMVYIRGNRLDYDHWRDLGNPGWSFADVLPYFKRSENYADGNPLYHGVGGPLNIERLRRPSPLSEAFVRAGAELGFPLNPDFNGPEQDGIGFYRVNQRDGHRHSVAAAYVHPVKSRPNLRIEQGARATRVLVERGRAVGVEYVSAGEVRTVRASSEVLLCLGTIASPHLLMLSGIGPAARLKELGIEAVVDLPGVGQNLHDHAQVAVSYECTQPILLDRSSNIGEAGGFLRTRRGLPAPDLQLTFVPTPDLNQDSGGTYGFAIGPAVTLPRSRGQLTLRSKDPLVPPALQPNYLAAEEDVEVLVEGVKLARTLIHARAFDEFRGVEQGPGSAAQSDAEIRYFIRARAQTQFHPVGTCRMGNDALSVVDPQLRVRGVEGLRVVDASVMPEIIRGNTHAPTIMIAEKAVDLIRASAQECRTAGDARAVPGQRDALEGSAV